MNPDTPPPRSPVLLLGDDWDAQPKRPRFVVIAAVIVVALIVTGFGLLRSRDQLTDSENERDWRPLGLLPAALSRDTEFHAPPVRVDQPPPVRSPAPEPPAPTAATRSGRPVVRTPPVPRGGQQVRPGYISINSRPWAELSVDGRVVGNTPQIKILMTPGPHQLLLTREGFQTYRAWVVVPPDGTVRLTDITLTAAGR
jgi:hypothetical protein